MNHATGATVDLLDYLAAEEASSVRHEYLGGSVHAMVGGSMRHNRIALNIASVLMRQLEGSPCQVFINDMKLHVQAADCVYYPDILVHCNGGIAGSAELVSDAALIVEVTSDSTEAIDRREKRAAYLRLPGLRVYWIVSQNEQQAEVHERNSFGKWQMRTFGPADCLPSAGLTSAPLPLATVYQGTDLA